jgi:hypothetical protein
VCAFETRTGRRFWRHQRFRRHRASRQSSLRFPNRCHHVSFLLTAQPGPIQHWRRCVRTPMVSGRRRDGKRKSACTEYQHRACG